MWILQVCLESLDRHGQGLGVVNETGMWGTALPLRPALGVRRLLQVLLSKVAERREVASPERLRYADGWVSHVIFLVCVDIVARLQDLVGDDSMCHTIQVACGSRSRYGFMINMETLL